MKRLAFILVSLLFLLWGMANNMNDTLWPASLVRAPCSHIHQPAFV